MGADVSSTAMCGAQAVSTTRNQQITGWSKPNMTYEELKVTGIVQEVIAPTDAERIVQSGRYSIELLKQLSGSTIVRLSSPTFDVPQPSHPNLVIIGTPMLVTINPPYIGKVRVRMPYEVPDFIDPNSISLYVRVGGSQWKYLDSRIDQENRTVWADVNDVSLFLDNANSAIFAVMGITCLNCQKVALDRIYDGGSRKAVLLVHGFTTDNLRWQAFIDDLVHTDSDWQIWTVSYPLSMNSDNAASELSSLIEQRASEFDKISFIMHSMGGIVTQKALKDGNENNYAWPKKVMDLILVGQPGLGSPSADVYGKLFATLVNIRSSALVWDQNSPLLTEAVNGLQVQKSPDAEYFVIAGRQSYPFTYELFKTNQSYLPNDGIISIFSARTVGGEQITDSCKHYFEVPRTHTDLLDDWLPRKIMQRILFRRDALENPDGIIAGYNKYVRIVEEDCRPGTIVIIGKHISEAETEDPLNCNCGNGVCGEGESELNCPQDCVTGYKYYYMCRVMPWVLGPLVALLVLLATIYVYHAISKHKRGEGAFWIMMISIIVVLLMLGMYLLCGFTMPLALLVMVFVLAILSFTIGHLHAEHKNGKKAHYTAPKPVVIPIKKQKHEHMPAKTHKPEKEPEIILMDGSTLKKLEKLLDRARGR
jgi:pimeloyl-ACP methyl ester carboxylesterase